MAVAETQRNYPLVGKVNFKLLCAALCFGLSGMSRGLDEGLISTTVAEPSFINEFDLRTSSLGASEKADRLSNITSMVHIGSIPGALVAFLLCERIGMLWSMRQLCVVWLTGVIIMITAGGRLGQIYGGRFVMGLGIGQAGIIAPTYLAEIAPHDIRGFLVCLFGLSEYIGIMIGYFSAWGASLHISNSSSKQWIIPQSIQIIVAGTLCLLSYPCEESPRYLCKVGKDEKARISLEKLWNLPGGHESISSEMDSIQRQLHIEQEQSSGQSWFSALRELILVADNQKRLLFVLSEQLVSQWSGATSVTTYAPELFALFGLAGQSQKLFTTAILGAVKLVASLVCAILLIDRIGRKRSLVSGILIQQVAMLYIAIYLTVESSSTDTESPSMKRAAIGAIVFLYFTGVGWAMGFNAIQYLINAEVFPLRVRAIGTSLLMCFHYANRYGLSKAVPSMLLEDALQPKGTFWFFSALTFFGLLWTLLLLPETARRNLEETNELFT
ncbi:Sugar and other transporter [Aspergillus sclerotialis]|uniref:Sugar and other transporter n=1 Tax=Aspergillus sclerotialis TaxID=2070753 RepID=A0A3A2ZI40_9EURO|nr:Sugar and other transporter [Aspergillus sclerotialis]